MGGEGQEVEGLRGGLGRERGCGAAAQGGGGLGHRLWLSGALRATRRPFFFFSFWHVCYLAGRFFGPEIRCGSQCAEEGFSRLLQLGLPTVLHAMLLLGSWMALERATRMGGR